MTTLAYAGAFLALAGVAGLAAASGTRWLLRLPVLAVIPLLAITVWWQLGQRDGWPAGAQPADGSAFVAGLVRAPAEGDAGAIYRWTQPPGSATPRAYRLPYSPELEREIAQASRAGKAGIRVAISRARPATRDRSATSQASRTGLRFVRLPPAEVPAKGVRRSGGNLTSSAIGGQDV
jgi:hypothetical protein